MFDKSLEPRLGKRLGRRALWYGYLGRRTVGLYQAPKLYAGNIPLMGGDLVATDDLRWMTPGRPIMGILGMDCLRHYCIQLDFAAGRMRFLDPDHLKTAELGNAFPVRRFLGQVITRAELFARRAHFALDSGDPGDGVLTAKLFRRELRQRNAVLTNGVAWFAQGALAGETYTNLMLSKCPLRIWFGHQNLIGLRFLARHLVTFNFPKRTMYLQRT